MEPSSDIRRVYSDAVVVSRSYLLANLCCFGFYLRIGHKS